MSSLLSSIFSVTRGINTVQPSYFTSSLFVNALREDFEILCKVYKEEHVVTQDKSPFILFKSLWVSKGWNWLHMKVLDARGRISFLSVVCRIFLGVLHLFLL